MAYGALASGLIGAGIAAGDDAKQRMTNANEEASRKRLLDMELETKLDYQNRVDELKFQKEGERLPEEIKRKGLISAAETKSKVDAEKLALNDPEYVKALRLKESIQNPDRGAELRRLQIDDAKESKAREKELRTWNARYQTMGANDPEFARIARAKIIELGGKDPAAQNGDYSIVKEGDETGAEKVTGVFDKNTGRIIPISKSSDSQIDGLPAGSKQIGTSAGKPVYETPDGKRFIQK